jgi:hypothetical protein
VRWAVNTAWTAFEAACEDALAVESLGNRFKDGLDEALEINGVLPPDWGSGLWQQVLRIYSLRKEYVHAGIPQDRLFAPLQEAEDAISVLRGAINDVYRRVGKSPPTWVDDDKNPEVPRGGLAHGTVARAGVRRSDPNRVRIVYEYQGCEHESEVLPPGTNPEPSMDRLLRTIIVPITAVRAYRGDHQLTHEWKVRMRGT